MALFSDLVGRGTYASRPAAGTEGALYYATDYGILYRDNGSSWDACLDINSLTADASPVSAEDYGLTYDATDGKLKKVLLDNWPGGAGDLGDLTYTPAVVTDWDGDADPGDADDAVDQLAARVDDLEVADVGALVHLTSNVNITSSSTTTLSWGVEDWDTDSIWTAGSPTVLTCQTAGKYLVIARIGWDTNANGYRQVSIVGTGTTPGTVYAVAEPNASNICVHDIVAVYDMSVSDTVAVQVRQDSGGTRAVQSAYSYFGMQLL